MNLVSIRVVPILKKKWKRPTLLFHCFYKNDNLAWRGLWLTMRRFSCFFLIGPTPEVCDAKCISTSTEKSLQKWKAIHPTIHYLLSLFASCFSTIVGKSLEKFFQGKRIFSSFWESLRLSEPSSANNRPNESWWLQNNARRLKFYLCTLVG